MSALAGLRVLDLTRVMAGPLCTMLLADMGAEVIKVEPPEGEETRAFGPPFIEGVSGPFLAVNRNKKSVTLNLKHPRGQALFLELVRGADVVVENYRPGTMEKLGLGYEVLSRENPALIYCAISGYGRTGPSSQRGGFDIIAQGETGIMSVTGEPGRPPVRAGIPVTDLGGGLLALYGILVAYVHRLRTGEGQLVDTSLMEAGVGLSVWESVQWLMAGQVPRPLGSAHNVGAPYQAFRTADGYMTIGASNQGLYVKLCKLLGREDLLTDERFATPGARGARRTELAEIIEAMTVTRPTADWLADLEKLGIPSGPILTYDKVYEHPQVQYREMVVEQEHPQVGRFKGLGLPVKLSRTPGAIRHAAPLVGEHNPEVLGLTADEIAALRAEGVL